MRDRFRRPLGNLRLSVTDRCNLRCSYCMPEADYTWLPRGDLLDFEELRELVVVFAGLGVEKVRLTGGEPLLRRDLHRLVALLREVPGIRDLALTTNGLLLADRAAALAEAGLGRVTVSLDTLDPQRFQTLTRRAELDRARAGVAAAAAAGLALKLNTVVMRGENDDELVDLVEYARGTAAAQPVVPRFIEYMDVGGATRWDATKVVSQAEMLARLGAHYGALEPLAQRGSAPAARYRLPDGFVIGIIASTTQPFCAACDRARITADGTLYTCLYAREGVSLRDRLRAGASRAELSAFVREVWSARRDRGAEERLALHDRTPLAQPAELRENPRLEMHTRGG